MKVALRNRIMMMMMIKSMMIITMEWLLNDITFIHEFFNSMRVLKS